MRRDWVKYGLWLCALVLLGWLLRQSTQVDVDRHIRIVRNFEQLRHQDARLNQYVLQARHGQLKNYDPIITSQQQIENILDRLQMDAPYFFGEGHSPIQTAFTHYRALTRSKSESVESFKSHNAVLRNSLRYFPIATRALLDQRASWAARDRLLHELLENVLLYDHAVDEALYGKITRTVAELQHLGGKDAQSLTGLAKHVSIILTHRVEVDDLVRDITQSHTAQLGEEVFSRYADDFAQREHKATQYKLAMALLSVAILFYVAWVMSNLAKARNTLRSSLRELEFQKFALDQHSIVSIADRAGKIIYTNDKFSEISLYSRQELLGQDHRLLNSGHHSHEFFRQMWETILAGKVWQGEMKNRRKDGTTYWVDSTIVPFMDEQGEPLRYVSIRSDITERKLNEALTRKAKEAAEEANRAKSDFLANMSHEIRTPMNGIIGMTELALDTELNAEQREYVGLVKTSADALLVIINDILDFSKIEAGKMSLEHIEFCVQDMLSQTVRAIAVRAHQKGLELLLDIDPQIPQMLIGDPGRLRQVILNLISNAIKFTEQGEVVVRVRLMSQVEEEVRLHISVSDTGIGIPADKQQAIFESFSQADSSTTRKYGGTGLGLTISSRLVELMQGKVKVASEVGKGSEFNVEVQLGKSATSVSPLFEAGKLSGLRVLVVDDNATNRQIILRLLQAWKMQPEAVACGTEALAEMARVKHSDERYQLLLLDVRMPDMDGFAVVEQLRSQPDLCDAPIMLLTSDGQRGDAARCRELGISAYLLKPFAQSDLFDGIMNVLGLNAVEAATLVTRHTLRQNRRSLNILLAEDNKINQTLATRLLQKFGHTVEVAPNGLLAIAQWQSGHYDLILMDVDMPELNGYGATAQIRLHERSTGQHIPIIGLTAHALPGSREECLAAGMDGYMSKPIDSEALWIELQAISADKTDVIRHDVAGTALKLGRDRAFDWVRAMQLMDNDAKLFNEMVHIFVQDYPALLQQLEQAVLCNDPAQIRHFAHTIKGMLSVFAVSDIAAIAERIELQPGVDHSQNCAELSEALSWLAQTLKEHTAAPMDWTI